MTVQRKHTMRVLFASPEAHPLIKTGGLADVAGSLPLALRERGIDVRLVLPAYPSVRERAENLRLLRKFRPGWMFGEANLLAATLPGSDLPVYLLESEDYFDRPGNPYLAPDGRDWPDNHLRFNLFNRAIVDIATNDVGLGWFPDVVHCHDWQTGLAPLLLSRYLSQDRPRTVFTIHNLAYQGLFPKAAMEQLFLPWSLWTPEGLEFYDHLSFMKGGIGFADHLTTVSPSYAAEIQTPELGYGLDDLLKHRANRLSGILNGIDYNTWNPATDPALAAPYSADDMAGKASNKAALQKRFGLPQDPDRPLLAHIGRLVSQKGVDLILDALGGLMDQRIQIVILGSGQASLEQRLADMAAAHPQAIGIEIGYDENLAHLIEAGADMFLMPSRFEPCGLNQLYSLRYGTPPIVRATGGLADTVTDARPEAIADGSATGFIFTEPHVDALTSAIHRAITAYADKPLWAAIQARGMSRDFSWASSAREYETVYRQVVENAQRELSRVDTGT